MMPIMNAHAKTKAQIISENNRWRRRRTELNRINNKQVLSDNSTKMTIRLGVYAYEEQDMFGTRTSTSLFSIRTSYVDRPLGFSVDGLNLIKRLLNKYPTIQSLDLENNYLGVEESIGFSEVRALASIIQESVNLRSINLRHLKLSWDKQIEIIAKALEHNTSLHSINLSKNRIGNTGAEFIANALKCNFTLTSVNLSETNIGKLLNSSEKGEKILAQIDEYLTRNKNLFDALCKAISDGNHVEFSRLISEKHVCVDQCNADGYTPLMLSAKTGNLRIVTLILQHCTNISDKYKGDDGDRKDQTAFDMIPDCPDKARIQNEIQAWSTPIRTDASSEHTGYHDEKQIFNPDDDDRSSCASVISESSMPTNYASSITIASSRCFFSRNDSSRIATKLTEYCNRYGEEHTITTKKDRYIKIKFESEHLGDKDCILQKTIRQIFSKLPGYQEQDNQITLPWNNLQDRHIQIFKATLTKSAEQLGLPAPLMESTLVLSCSAVK